MVFSPRSLFDTRGAPRRLFLCSALFAALWVCTGCGDTGGQDRTHPQSDLEFDLDAWGGEDVEEDVEDDVEGDVEPDVEPDTTPPCEGVPDPLPEGDQGAILSVCRTESWSMDGLRDEVHVVRTEMSVPHIYARNTHDLYMVEGFTMARDRYIEFELGRRLGLGRISELLGSDALSVDQESRGLGRRWIAQRILETLDEDQLEIFDAYAAGINAYIAQVKNGTLPVPSELEIIGPILGGQGPDFMETVTREDIAGFIAVIVSQLGFETFEIQMTAVRDRLPTLFQDAPLGDLRREGAIRDIFDTVGPIYPVSSAAGWSIEGSGAGKPSTPPILPEAQRPSVRGRGLESSLLQRFSNKARAIDKRLGRNRAFGYGSNGWAVSAEGTASGGSLLAGDGHLPLGVPAIFYQIGLDNTVFAEDADSGDIHQLGLVFPGFPLMTVGTNGSVAWTQTYLYADITDWYREEIRLNDAGEPTESFFQGEWRPLNKTEESYFVASTSLSPDPERTEITARWTTFDGRWLVDVEGFVPEEGAELGEGQAVVTMLGTSIVPSDQNGDGVIEAVSFDYTGFDVSNIMRVVDMFHKVESVDQWREETKGLVAYAQNIVASDRQGNITYTGYNGIPCRQYLARDDRGAWLPGADPRFLLDGTTYGGFTVPLNADGTVDESQADDPYRCVIPFENFPQSVNPERNFVLTANNDPGNITTDGSITDDPWYMGFAWAAGYRADTIQTTLQELSDSKSADIDSMAALQGDIQSRLGQDISPELFAALDRAKALNAQDPASLSPSEARIAALYSDNALRFDEVQERISTWVERGALAKSGVQTFYNQPTEDDRRDAVATMLFNAWFRDYFKAIFDDEDLGDIWIGNGNANRMRALIKILDGRGENNPLDLASWNEDTQESAFFDLLTTEPIETSHEIALIALAQALTTLEGPSSNGVGGFNTDNMEEWLWGMRHLVVLESILVGFAGDNPAVGLIAGPLSITTNVLKIDDEIPNGDPRRALPWFPRQGDRFAVDAANHSWDGPDYFYRNGPVMRMVIELTEEGVSGQNILPGGQSGITDSPHFADQAALWLGNETLPMRFTPTEVAEGATGREHFTPAN